MNRSQALSVPKGASQEQLRATIGQISAQLQQLFKDQSLTDATMHTESVVYQSSRELVIRAADPTAGVVADASVAPVMVWLPPWTLGRRVWIKKLDSSPNPVTVTAVDGGGIEQFAGGFAASTSWTTARAAFAFVAISAGPNTANRVWIIAA